MFTNLDTLNTKACILRVLNKTFSILPVVIPREEQEPIKIPILSYLRRDGNSDRKAQQSSLFQKLRKNMSLPDAWNQGKALEDEIKKQYEDKKWGIKAH